MEIQYRVWRSKTCAYEEIFCKRTGIYARGKSRRLQRVLCDFGCEQSFAKAAGQVIEHYGFDPGVYAVRKNVLSHARRACQERQKQTSQTFRSLPAKGCEHLIGQADGSMVCIVAPAARKAKHPREWKEMRLVAAKAKESASAVYGAGFFSVEEAGRLWGHCARDAGWGLNSAIHVVADGAEWIRKQSQETFGDQHTFLVDFYHVSQYLANASESCRPLSPARWRKTQQKRLLQGRHDKVLTELYSQLEPENVSDESAPVRGAYRYLQHRSDALDYPRATALELPIGSGLVESGHKHVIQQRLKLPGSAWLHQSAHSIAQLRSLRANDLWNSLWN